MKPLLFVRCDPVETFGIALSAAADAGIDVEVWESIDPNAKRPDLDAVAGVVVFGSTFNVEHADEQPFIKEVGQVARDATERGIPFLGLCFGAQVLVWALGGTIAKAPVREIGFVPIAREDGAHADPVLGHYDDGTLVFQWHMDAFDIPGGGRLLLSGDPVRNQAIRVGEKTWATQFHAEIDAAEAEYWVALASAEEDLQTAWGKPPEQVREEIATHMADHERLGRETFRRFVDVAREHA